MEYEEHPENLAETLITKHNGDKLSAIQEVPYLSEYDTDEQMCIVCEILAHNH